jgi:ribosomal protein L11 methyltransferase
MELFLKQSSLVWRVDIVIPFHLVSIFDEILENHADAVASSENADEILWTMSLYFTKHPDTYTVKTQLVILSELYPDFSGDYTIEQIKDINWLQATLQSFKPFSVDRFYIYGSHSSETTKSGSIPLLIDASTAFGTGEHQSTAGCLLAFSKLLKHRKFHEILDMGCGTGILGFAASKTLKKKALVVDIDPESIRVAKRSARINQLHPSVTCKVSTGYKNRFIQNHRRFDLIFSNILAKPLCRMAKDASHRIQKDGILILSGLLWSQKNQVLKVHQLQNFKMLYSLRLENWCTLVLQKM